MHGVLLMWKPTSTEYCSFNTEPEEEEGGPADPELIVEDVPIVAADTPLSPELGRFSSA